MLLQISNEPLQQIYLIVAMRNAAQFKLVTRLPPEHLVQNENKFKP
jgi:hypothetical protein